MKIEDLSNSMLWSVIEKCKNSETLLKVSEVLVRREKLDAQKCVYLALYGVNETIQFDALSNLVLSGLVTIENLIEIISKTKSIKVAEYAFDSLVTLSEFSEENYKWISTCGVSEDKVLQAINDLYPKLSPSNDTLVYLAVNAGYLTVAEFAVLKLFEVDTIDDSLLIPICEHARFAYIADAAIIKLTQLREVRRGSLMYVQTLGRTEKVREIAAEALESDEWKFVRALIKT